MTQHGHLQTQEIQIDKHIVSAYCITHNLGVCVLYMLQEYILKEEILFSSSNKQKTGNGSSVKCCVYDI